MSPFRLWLGAAGVILLACGSEPRAPKQPAFSAAFSTLPLPPNPELVSHASSADALQLTVSSPADVDQVTDFYRNVLSRGNWRLVSDLKGSDGATVLYAEQDGPPLWVRIWKPGGRSGTLVQLTGAVIAKDSAKSRRGTDSSSRRR